MTGCSDTLLEEDVSAVHCAAAGFTSVQLQGKDIIYVTGQNKKNTFRGWITHRYKAEGPIIDARNADTTPEPLPTSRITAGLHAGKENISMSTLRQVLHKFY